MLDSLMNAVGYHYGAFPPASFDYQKVIPSLVRATDALARYDQMMKGMHNSEILLAPLRNQEAVISSRIEGTISTMDEILQFAADDEGDDANASSVRSEVYETYLYQRALSNAQRSIKEGRPFSKHMIKDMHQQLLYFGRGAKKSPGKFKVEQNYLADKSKILFVPISPEKLGEGLDNLFEYMSNDESPALLKTAIMHLEFEALHPFQDGNGRIGRMLITLFLWTSKIISQPHFYISEYLEEHKDEYIDNMRKVSQTGKWEEWCMFFLDAVEAQAIRNLDIAENIRKLYDEMKIKFSERLSSKWSVLALDYIFTNPIFRNSRFTAHSGIPSQTAFRFTRILLDNGFLRTIHESSGRRSALYSFEPLMQLVRV
jgi:Fic family protein